MDNTFINDANVDDDDDVKYKIQYFSMVMLLEQFGLDDNFLNVDNGDDDDVDNGDDDVDNGDDDKEEDYDDNDEDGVGIELINIH